MSVLRLSVALVVVLVAAASGARANGEVIALTADSFDSTIATNGGRWLVEFYADWCGVCNHFKPSYEKVAKDLAHKKNIHVAKVNVDSQLSLALRFQVQAIPKLFLIDEEGQVYPYDDSLQVEPLTAFAHSGDKAVEPWTGVFSPMQTGAKVIGTVGYYAQRVVNGIKYLEKEQGVPIVAIVVGGTFAIMLLAYVIGYVLMFIVSIFSSPLPKQQAQHAAAVETKKTK